MVQASHSILLLCPFLVVTLFQIHAQAGYLSSTCSGPEYNNGSYFESNLISLLDSLYTNATTNGSFSALSVGDWPNQAYGLIMCYNEYTVDYCWSCLKNVTSLARELCPGNSTASIFYDECLLRYSDKDFRSQVANFNDHYCLYDANPNDPLLDDTTKSLVSNLISNLSTEASQNTQLAAYRQITTNTARNITALVQCTRDLPQDKCVQCLQSATVTDSGLSISYCSFNLTKAGMRIMYGSCYIQYESFHINFTEYPGAAAPASPPSGPAVNPQAGPAANSVVKPAKGTETNSTVAIVVSVVVSFLVAGLAAFGFFLWRISWPNRNNEDNVQETVETELKYILNPNAEYQVFNFTILKIATDDFSEKNKLGKGGFGPVYKGVLPDGQEIAVKRLSNGSVQGITEFKNEVDFLAKLKHKNLVQLLGCCITNQEKLLCYEYLPSGSLDKILFGRDMSRRAELSWKLRYKIIEGISHGLHYLHQESRLKIIHRDLKVSNILLDKDMNPKISDFGLARFFEDDETHKDTNILAGTFGYMAPEYIFYGNFSMKSDVYSFGILLLEILTGQKNSSFVGSGRISNFIEHALIHWNNNTISQLMDPALEEDCNEEVKRCAHIALLCVQEDPINRPTMAIIRNMLGSPSLTIPDLPSVWSPFGQLNFPISSESSTTKTLTNKSKAESSKGTTNESECSSLIDGSR
ncbi:cysteine-rich RECEPTOR-like kinase [Rhynchospora pubera]|uniref:non-specific serine/threonine protein kinase n=1 Tax=Rhynchospora pubera TaxID=906938 RepID=A0AAV8EKL2_9POAL|nr:cysteine-rich RECEPTOR-like kinase [Rhynchospora pubera]